MEVGETYAKVITIVDPRSSISIMLERSRDEGILKGCLLYTSKRTFISFIIIRKWE